ncbi:MAG TPA: helix-turn-helix domain-containing protein [Longimicrobium sp.]|nr:helix-turn-helix domain-containing protein [Longimicrobium sp.]
MTKRSLPATTAPEALPAPLAAPTLWSAFGLASDPFLQAELRADPSALYPVSLHVGRDAELRLLLRQLGGSPSTRVLVEGEAGLGKTSLANKLKAELAPHMLSHPEPVRITGDTGALGFTADVLRVILRIRTLLDLPAGDFWTTAARLVEGEDTVGAGFNPGPVGIQYQGGRIAAEAPSGSLHPVLEEALARTERDAGKPILVHVNNLENLAEPDALRAARLLRDVRDTLLLPGAHWLFVGAAGVEETVFRRYDQVGGIFPAAVVLDPLSAEEVAELLRRRYAHLSLGTTVVPPVEPEVAARLYSLYLGDLRNFLRLLGDACAAALGIDGVHPLSAERIIHAAAPRYLNAIRRRIGDPDTTHLLVIARERGGGEFFVAQAADATGLSQSAASRLLARLREAGLVVQTRQEGKKVFYRPTGHAAVAFRVVPRPSPETDPG